MTRRGWDRTFGLAFAGVGAAVAATGLALPAGVAGVPGPGVFPVGIGLALVALGLALALSASRRAALSASPRAGTTPEEPSYFGRGPGDPATLRVAATLALLAAYAAAWTVVPFAWRTLVLLVALYRLFGAGWLRSATIAALVTGAVVIVFQVLFRVRL